MTRDSFARDARGIASMRRSCKLAASILQELAGHVAVGTATHEFDTLARKRLKQVGVRSAFLGEGGFPATVCASVNAIAVHGPPLDAPLRDGDLLKLDFGVIVNGWYSDVAVTVPVGNVGKHAQKLLTITQEALVKGIEQATPGNRTGDISWAIQQHVELAGFEVIRELAGHGVGKSLHEPPQVQNFGKPGSGEELREGMLLAIEPITSISSKHARLAKDGFGYETIDGSLAAHFEHTVLITENGPEILTNFS